MRENAQRSAEYRAVESAKHPKPRRGVITATGTWVAPCISQAWVAIILGIDTEPAMLKKELETAKELVTKAGNILLERYQENPSVSWKGVDAPVTAADRAASEFLVRELKRLFPGDGILSEWGKLRRLIEAAAREWRDPDHGVWEVRMPGRPFTYSAALCQVALDRGAKMVERFKLPGEAAKWREAADEI